MFDNPGTVIVAIAVLVPLLGSGIGAAFFVGRRTGRAGSTPAIDDHRDLAESFARELERCLELGDYVTRDADMLSATAAAQSPALSRELANAVQQLVKTSKSLAGRLNRMGTDASLARPQFDGRPIASSTA